MWVLLLGGRAGCGSTAVVKQHTGCCVLCAAVMRLSEQHTGCCVLCAAVMRLSEYPLSCRRYYRDAAAGRRGSTASLMLPMMTTRIETRRRCASHTQPPDNPFLRLRTGYKYHKLIQNIRMAYSMYESRRAKEGESDRYRQERWKSNNGEIVLRFLFRSVLNDTPASSLSLSLSLCSWQRLHGGDLDHRHTHAHPSQSNVYTQCSGVACECVAVCLREWIADPLCNHHSLFTHSSLIHSGMMMMTTVRL